jgi:hypothetical protein
MHSPTTLIEKDLKVYIKQLPDSHPLASGHALPVQQFADLLQSEGIGPLRGDLLHSVASRIPPLGDHRIVDLNKWIAGSPPLTTAAPPQTTVAAPPATATAPPATAAAPPSKKSSITDAQESKTAAVSAIVKALAKVKPTSSSRPTPKSKPIYEALRIFKQEDPKNTGVLTTVKFKKCLTALGVYGPGKPITDKMLSMAVAGGSTVQYGDFFPVAPKLTLTVGRPPAATAATTAAAVMESKKQRLLTKFAFSEKLYFKEKA